MIKVISKIKLSEELKNEIITKLALYLKKEINKNEVHFETDNTIIGGVKIIIQSKVIDLTINRKLENIINIIKD